jgi:hypothetical protein
MVDLHTAQSRIGGCSGGKYFKVRRRGYKIYPHKPERIYPEKECLEKLNALIPGIFPKCYGIKTVTRKGREYPALWMEHIEGVMGEDGDGSTNEDFHHKSPALRAVWARIKAVPGLEVGDHIHGWNVIETPQGDFRFIDADPLHTHFDR